MDKLGRNELCHCGSGKKYKKCCLASDEQVALSKKTDHSKGYDHDDWEDDEIDFEEGLDVNDYDEEAFDADDLGDDDEFDEEDFDEIEGDLLEEYSDKIKDEYPEISEEDEKLVDAWWETYGELDDPEKEKMHLEQFMAAHPTLVVSLGLHYEVLFELGAAYLKIGKYAEFIIFLMRIRQEFPDSYLKSAGYYDRDIIIWLISEGRVDEVHKYTNLLEAYPIDFLDQVIELRNLLLATNNFEHVWQESTKAYKRMYDAGDVRSPFTLLNPEAWDVFGKYIVNNREEFTVTEFISELSTRLELELDEEDYSAKFWQAYYNAIIRPFTLWESKVPKKKTQLSKLYQNISVNFVRYIKEKQHLDWPSANYLGDQIFDYLSSFMEDSRIPKKLFNFSIKVLDKQLGNLCKDYIYIDFIKYVSILHAIYYFADYLYECGTLSETEKNVVKDNVSELFKEQYPQMKTMYAEALIFSRFPYF